MFFVFFLVVLVFVFILIKNLSTEVKMKIKKLLRHLAISLTLRLESLKWTALVILTALGVVKKVNLERKDVLPEIIHWLRWLSRDIVEGRSELARILTMKTNLGMKIMVRGP